eukprot:4144951-Prymnesium_polylepis.1
MRNEAEAHHERDDAERVRGRHDVELLEEACHAEEARQLEEARHAREGIVLLDARHEADEDDDVLEREKGEEVEPKPKLHSAHIPPPRARPSRQAADRSTRARGLQRLAAAERSLFADELRIEHHLVVLVVVGGAQVDHDVGAKDEVHQAVDDRVHDVLVDRLRRQEADLNRDVGAIVEDEDDLPRQTADGGVRWGGLRPVPRRGGRPARAARARATADWRSA